MIKHNISRVLVTCGAIVAGFGCSAGAPGTGGDPEVTREAHALSSADVGGVQACQVADDAYADCMIDPAYPIYSSYSVGLTPDDGSAGWTFIAKTEITGKTTSEGTPVRLSGPGWKGVWSWKPVDPPVESKGALETKFTIAPVFRFYCLYGACFYTATPDKPPTGR